MGLNPTPGTILVLQAFLVIVSVNGVSVLRSKFVLREGALMAASEEGTKSFQEVLGGVDPLIVLGLGFCQMGMTTRWQPLYEGFSASASGAQSLLLLSCSMAILTFAACLSAYGRVARYMSTSGWKVVVGLVCVIGVVFVSLESAFFERDMGALWFFATAVGTGIGSALLLLTWAVLVIEGGSILNFPLAFLVGSVGLGVWGLIEPYLSDSMVAETALSVVPVAVSAALLLFTKSSSALTPPMLKGLSQNVAIFMLKVGLGALLVSMANEMIKLVRPDSAGVVLASDISSWVTVVVMAAVAVGVVYQLWSGKPSGFYFICKAAIVLCVFGALLFPYAGAAGQLLFSISTAGRQCLQLLVWMIVLMVCRKNQLPSVAFFGFMCVAWNGGSLAGSALYDAFGAMEPVGDLWGTQLVSVIAVLLLVTAFAFLFSEKDSHLMFGETKTSKKERAFHKVCEALCEHGRLTAREREVFVLLAKGAPVSAIEEKLFISTSTVSTHMKHIYQKLGVHSRGELYDLVDAEMNAFLAK